MIESITATIPVVGQSYTDLRPTISANSVEEYREQLAEVGRLAGNEAFVNRMLQNQAGKKRIITKEGDLFFDEEEHVYKTADGQTFWTGSTWAHQFIEDFNPDFVAKKVADKKLTTVDKVIEGWNMKGEVSTMYGSTVHKAMECGIKYGELPNHPRLADLVQDYLDQTHNDEQYSEQFVSSFKDRMCGTIDVLVKKGEKRAVIRDFKTGDIYKKVKLTDQAKEYWPNLESKMISVYQLQLSFYAYILKQLGYTVEGLEIWAEGIDAWEVVKLSILDISKALQAV